MLDSEIASLRARIAELELPFARAASELGVPIQVVADAALHTFDKLDLDDQDSLVKEALARWDANQKMRVSEGVVIAERSGQMRDDLIYRLQHEHFDAVYAVVLRRDDAAAGGENAQWIMTPQRDGEAETPPERSIAMMEAVCEALRRARQRFESVLSMQRAKLRTVR